MKVPRLFRSLLVILVITGSLAPLPGSTSAQSVEVIVENPELNPSASPCPDSYWYPLANDRGHTTYLTLNTPDPGHSSNSADWHPLIPQDGYYQVEAYIAGHDAITWCTGENPTIQHDTADAHYSIHHTYGVAVKPASQYPLSNAWLNLGEYYFNAGDSGYVSLTDLNGEAEYTTTISFSAMRFTLTRFTRPQNYLPLVHSAEPVSNPPPKVGLIQAQGFDACHLPTIAEMQTWWNSSPYSFYALYLGGIHVPSFCAKADAAWISAVHLQGWSFVPTWVGPQAPCSIYAHKMSSDPAISYLEGRQEADSAALTAASVGLTSYGLGGTIIYYDLEPYGYPSPECRNPVSAFMNGWVERLHELGNFTGAYGSRNSYPYDWATILHPLEYVWAASWYTTHYDPYASVFPITWLDGLWMNHQRLRQYAGEVNNTWGGVTMGIDINVADGMVALPPTKPLAAPVVLKSASIDDTGWLSEEQGWLISAGRLYWTKDQGNSWTELLPAPVQLAFFLNAKQGWAISTSDQREVTLYHTTDGASWQKNSLSTPPDGWWPVQLQFRSPENGWIVLQKETSQIFSLAILMKTLDGGHSWQTYDLPAAGKISFTSLFEGWLQDNLTGDLYQTEDGGLTWHPALPAKSPLPHPELPAGTVTSGWQTERLGWSVTAEGSCSGDKSSGNISCQVNTALWQTLDGGEHWIPVPTVDLIPATH